MSRMQRAIFFVVFILLCVEYGFAYELYDVIFKVDNLPAGWEMKNNITVDKSSLPFYEKKFNIKPLMGLSNQVFKVNHKYRLQVNFIQCKDSKQAERVAKYFRKRVVKTNRILQKGNIVIEIITKPHSPEIKDQVTRLLAPVKIIK